MAQTNKYRTITIANQTYKLPIDGMGNWGEEATAILEALSEGLSLLLGPNDILPSTATINNNSSNTVLGNVSLNVSQIRQLKFEYVVNRSFGPENSKTLLTQSGTVTGNYNSETSEWVYSHEYEGSAGVQIDIVENRIRYTSSNVSPENYQGSIRFKGSSLDKTV